MAITKPEFWLGSLAFIMIISFSLLLFGTSLQNNNNINLDEDSNTYLGNYSKLIGSAGITEKVNTDLDNESVENPIKSKLNKITDFIDVFGVFSLLGNIFGGFWSFLSLAFNLPNFFLETLGLDLGGFKHIVNILGLIFTLAFTLIIVREVK